MRIVLVALLAVLTACSDDGLSKEEFIAQADAICEAADEKTRELEPPKSPDALTEFVVEAQEITAQLLSDLRELQPPEEDRAVIDTMLSKIEEAMSYLPQIRDAAQKRDLQEVSRLGEELQAAASEANETAREYGLERCGRAQPAAAP
ncbi:MAG: hypothetical protein M3N53_12595 [Actinomycetota bacterium]|nr:hypothetical protein [Actinomycetota bacterium]